MIRCKIGSARNHICYHHLSLLLFCFHYLQSSPLLCYHRSSSVCENSHSAALICSHLPSLPASFAIIKHHHTMSRFWSTRYVSHIPFDKSDVSCLYQNFIPNTSKIDTCQFSKPSRIQTGKDAVAEFERNFSQASQARETPQSQQSSTSYTPQQRWENERPRDQHYIAVDSFSYDASRAAPTESSRRPGSDCDYYDPRDEPLWKPRRY